MEKCGVLKRNEERRSAVQARGHERLWSVGVWSQAQGPCSAHFEAVTIPEEEKKNNNICPTPQGDQLKFQNPKRAVQTRTACPAIHSTGTKDLPETPPPHINTVAAGSRSAD